MRPPKKKLVLCLAVVAILAIWETAAIYVGSKDNDKIVWLEDRGAEITRWTSYGPMSFCDYDDGLGEVQAVSFADRHIGEEDISVLLDLKSCYFVSFGNCTFQDRKLLCKLNSMPDLNSITLFNSSANDELLSDVLPSLINIKFLGIYNNPISDSSIDVLAKLPNLRGVSAGNTQITSEGWASLRKLRPDISVGP